MRHISINSKVFFSEVLGKDQAALAPMCLMRNLFKFYDPLIELSITEK